VTREELLERANRWSVPRYGVRITRRTLEDWVHECLLPGPTQQPHPGQRAANWQWSAKSYRRLLQVCRFKKRGLASFDRMRIQLWLNSKDPITAVVRQSMRAECRWLFKRLFRPLRNDYEAGRLSPARISRMLPKIDPALKPFADLIPSTVWPEALDAARFGTSFSGLELFKAIAQCFGPDTAGRLWSKLAGPEFSGQAQLAEDDDEPIAGSLEHSFATANADLFERARPLTRSAPFVLRRFLALLASAPQPAAELAKTITPSFRTAADAVQSYPFNFLTFGLFLHSLSRSPTMAEASARFEPHSGHAGGWRDHGVRREPDVPIC
jgi:hypothetical protein